MIQCPYCKSNNVAQVKHDTSHRYKCYTCGNIFIFDRNNINQKESNASKNFTVLFCIIFIIVIYLTTCTPFFKGIFMRHSDTTTKYTAEIIDIDIKENNWFKYQTKYYADIEIEFKDNDTTYSYTFNNIRLSGGETMASKLKNSNTIDIFYDGNKVELVDNVSFKNNIIYFILATIFSSCLLFIIFRKGK